MIIPSGLSNIQPRDTQVWKYDEIGFYPNGRCNKVVCTYKLFQGEWMWKVQTGERSTSWCTLLVINWSDDKCFMPPIIVNQSKEYSQDLQFNIPLGWKVHHTLSGYMDIYGWLKAMNQFSNVCGASPVNDQINPLFNNKILLFDGNDSHFDDRALRHMECQNIQPFVLKSGNSTNN